MEAVNHSTRKHALLSASGASRWLSCTPSARLEERFENVTTDYAAEGTLAHEFADIGVRFLSGQMTKRDYNKAIEVFRKHHLYTDEMEDEVQVHIDYVLEQFNEAKRLTKDAILVVEEKLDLTDYIEEGFGTGDDLIIANGVLEIIDLKYGKGIRVSAQDNSQLKVYGLGALRKYEMMYDIKVVKLTIVQPRMDSISSWEISTEDLLDWGENVVAPKAIEAYSGQGKFVPGDWCRFCKAKANCKAVAELNLAACKLDFKKIAEPKIELNNVQVLEDNEILDLFEKASQIKSWLEAVEAHVKQLALEGKNWEGYKMVAGKSSRKWSDQEAVLEALREADLDPESFVNRKLKGITIVEKELGKPTFQALLADYIIKPEGAPTLVPLSDKRKALGNDSAIEDFTLD